MRQFDINTALKKMNARRDIAVEKGTAGEEAVLGLIQSYMEIRGGALYHSYSYPYAQNRHGIYYPGNIYLEGEKYLEVPGRAGLYDEIDVLYITPSRIFSIEVKARGGKWKLYDHWATQNSRLVDKSPMAQAEKHARHLYHQIYEYLPNGSRSYIVPLVVLVDKAELEDSRSMEFKQVLPVARLNNLKAKISSYDTTLAYSLNVDEILLRLKNIGSGKLYI